MTPHPHHVPAPGRGPATTPVGHALAALPHARGGVADAALEGTKDESYRWVRPHRDRAGRRGN
ncbi:hypothetical protein [Streptomyces caniferus]|uniref:hypothetical protein n=1 Tax=Streptomyces caniferus TaxID=285557 RepID=UPI0037F1FE1E